MNFSSKWTLRKSGNETAPHFPQRLWVSSEPVIDMIDVEVFRSAPLPTESLAGLFEVLMDLTIGHRGHFSFDYGEQRGWGKQWKGRTRGTFG